MSYYNFLIPVKQKQVYLLYNSLTNKLYEVEEQTGLQIQKWSQKKTIPRKEFLSLRKEYIQELFAEGFIVKSDADELNFMHSYLQEYRKKFLQTGIFTLTLLPTNQCNMACRYCFEEIQKSGVSHMDDKTMNNIIHLIENEIIKSENKFTKLYITWFGGEPLCAPGVIEKLSGKLISVAEKYDLNYKSNIITNGVYLKSDMLLMLQKCKITNVQVTIDGCRDTHNLNRPLKRKNHHSFDIILNNLKNIPDDINVQLRINADREVFETIKQLFVELNERDIWPQKRKNIHLYLGHKFYTNPDKVDLSYYTREEFARIEIEFSKIKIDFYNDWASKNNMKPAKLALKYPDRPSYYCITANHPYGLSIDSEGNVHKCLEYCNGNSNVIGNINNGYESLRISTLFNESMSFDKILFDNECSICKFLPICKEGMCMAKHRSMIQEKPCTPWKYTLEELLRSQYLLTVNEPEKIQSFAEIFGNSNRILVSSDGK